MRYATQTTKVTELTFLLSLQEDKSQLVPLKVLWLSFSLHFTCTIHECLCIYR